MYSYTCLNPTTQVNRLILKSNTSIPMKRFRILQQCHKKRQLNTCCYFSENILRGWWRSAASLTMTIFVSTVTISLHASVTPESSCSLLSKDKISVLSHCTTSTYTQGHTQSYFRIIKIYMEKINHALEFPPVEGTRNGNWKVSRKK